MQDILEYIESELEDIERVEREAVKNDKIKYIFIKIDKKKIIEIKRLFDKNYEIMAIEENKYLMRKEIIRKRSLRVSLTENCNYKCFFCHEEGLEMDVKREERSIEELYNVIRSFIFKGYNDITFTGGEPLVKTKEIIEIIEKLSLEGLKPKLTIVTNGYLIDDDLLLSIKRYKGEFKFNFSMHAVDKEKYMKIVNPKNQDEESFEKVCKNIIKIKDNNISLKMNFVLLKGINTSKEYIEKILDFGVKHKVDCIKFLELLITDKLINMYKYYYQIGYIKELIKDKIEYNYSESRRDVYSIKKSNMKMELQKCTCELGCNSCAINRDFNISQELKYYPCFILPNSPIDISKGYEEEKIKKGNMIIEKFSKEYGELSPRIISKPKFVKEKKEFYYISKNCSLDAFLKKLSKDGYKIEIKRDFTERYYRPRRYDEKWTEFERVYKVYSNSYNENEYIEVLQEVDYSNDGEGIVQNVKYLNGKKIVRIKDLKEYEKRLDIMDFEMFLMMEWSTYFLKKREKTISIGYNIGKNKVTILSKDKRLEEDFCKTYELEGIQEKLFKYLGC